MPPTRPSHGSLLPAGLQLLLLREQPATVPACSLLMSDDVMGMPACSVLMMMRMLPCLLMLASYLPACGCRPPTYTHTAPLQPTRLPACCVQMLMLASCLPACLPACSVRVHQLPPIHDHQRAQDHRGTARQQQHPYSQHLHHAHRGALHLLHVLRFHGHLCIPGYVRRGMNIFFYSFIVCFYAGGGLLG